MNAPAPACTVWSTTSTTGPSWSPWEDLDPDLQRTYTGPDQGSRRALRVDGQQKAGRGSMEITRSTPEEIVIALEFLKPFKSTSTTVFQFAADGEARPHVTWRMTGEQTGLMAVFGRFMNMDKLIGPDFEKGLARLKVAAEVLQDVIRSGRHAADSYDVSRDVIRSGRIAATSYDAQADSDDGPGVAAADQAGQRLALVALTGRGGGDLLARLVVVRRTLHLPEDADRRLVQHAGVGEPGERERRRRVVGVGVVDQQVGLVDVGGLRRPRPRRRRSGRCPWLPSTPKRIGSPWTSGMIASALVSGCLIASNAPSLKIGQFW